MNQSFRIGSVFGITVRIHALLILMVAFVVLNQGASGLILALTLFGIVFLHELGHVLVAQSFGIRVVDIILWPLGGLTRMTEIPEDSKTEGWIAFAGPAVNLGLALLTLPLVLVLSPEASLGAARTYGLAQMFLWLNVVLGVFNLIPAFPMDGARVLRALLARRGRSWLQATEVTAKIGQYAAFGMALFGPFLVPLPLGCFFWVPMGAMVWWSCMSERIQVRRRHGQSPFGESFRGFGGFGGGGGSGMPFEDLFRGAQGEPNERDVDPGGAATEPPSGFEKPEIGGSGISDAEIERLEKFRGSLRGFRKRKDD